MPAAPSATISPTIPAMDYKPSATSARALSSPKKAQKPPATWSAFFKNLLLAPLFPMAGYLLLDQTGISQFFVQQGFIPSAVLGEGFGHVGLCFSFHYVLNALKLLFPLITGFFTAQRAL